MTSPAMARERVRLMMRFIADLRVVDHEIAAHRLRRAVRTFPGEVNAHLVARSDGKATVGSPRITVCCRSSAAIW